MADMNTDRSSQGSSSSSTSNPPQSTFSVLTPMYSPNSSVSSVTIDGGSSCMVHPEHHPANQHQTGYPGSNAPWPSPPTESEAIAAHVESRLQELPRMAQITRDFPLFRQKTVHTIVDETSGNLYSKQYAETLLHDLELAAERIISTHPLLLRAFHDPIDYSMHPAVRHLCQDMVSLFRSPLPAHYHQALLQRLLTWFHFSKTPLTVHELLHAASYSLFDNPPQRLLLPTVADLNSVLGEFFYLPENKQTIFTPSHLKEDLLNYFNRHGGAPYNRFIAQACLAYIRDSIGSSGPCPDNHSLEERLQQFPFLPHAVKYWYSYVDPSWNLQHIADYFNNNGMVQAMMQILSWSDVRWLSEPSKKIDLSQRYYKSTTRLDYAASIGCSALVEVFLARGDWVDGIPGFQLPIGLAAMHGHNHVVELLSRKGANLNACDFAGRTALYIAATEGFNVTVQLLLNLQVDVNIPAKDGSTPLMAAICNGHLQVAQQLVNYGAQLLHEAIDKQTALSYAFLQPGFSDFAATMLGWCAPYLWHLSKEANMTLWEAIKTINDQRLLRRLKIIGSIRTADSANMNSWWPKEGFLHLLVGSDGDPEVGRAPESAKEERKKKSMIVPLDGYFRRRFMLKRHLGTGAFSSVMEASDLVTGKDVAIKFLMELDSSSAEKECRKEYGLMSKLDHPNVSRCLDDMTVRGSPIIVTDLAQKNLTQRLGTFSCFHQLPEQEIKHIFVQIMRGLSHMHSRNIVHRDLKPENILVFDEDILKIADLGNSKKIPKADEGFVDYFPCTPSHIPPEAIGANPEERILGKPGDVYSAGVILYQLVCTLQPFWRDKESGDEKMLERVNIGNLHFDKDIWSPANIEAMHLIARMMDSNPYHRPTAEQVLQHPWLTGDREMAKLLDFKGLRLPHRSLGAFVSKEPEWVTRSAMPNPNPRRARQSSSFTDELEAAIAEGPDFFEGVDPETLKRFSDY